MESMDEIKKELKIIKYLLVFVTCMVALAILSIISVIAWVNYQGPKSEEQKESLSVIQNLKNAKQPEIDSSRLPDVAPEIYDDTDVNDGFDEAMGGDDDDEPDNVLAHDQPATGEFDVENP